MFWRPKAVNWEASRAVPHVLVATLLVAGFAMFMMLTAGVAQACPPGKVASGSVSIVHKAKHAIAMMSVISAPALAKDMSGRCCGGGSHSHGIGCANGCCSACLAAIDIASSGLLSAEGSICHFLPRQSGVVSSRPPPDFRPPRTFA
jgi:hypothetical protein